MSDRTPAPSLPVANGDVYRVRGLTCNLCVGTALENLRLLPGVEGLGAELVPYGVSTVTVSPAGVATRGRVREVLRRSGFRLLSGRHHAHP